MPAYTFPKSEKLKSKKKISYLFESGDTLKSYPLILKYDYAVEEHDSLCQAGFTVPKRRFKQAVTRNQIKRRIREAYRLNKHKLSTDSERSWSLMFIYTAADVQSYSRIEKAMNKIIASLSSLDKI